MHEIVDQILAWFLIHFVAGRFRSQIMTYFDGEKESGKDKLCGAFKRKR
jgi:hypothetical protein